MTSNPEPARGLHILIVEDSMTQSLKLQHLLERHAHRVTVARDGIEALESVRAHPPQLIITDVNMPKMDGYGLCARIKDDPDLQDVPVILLTSLSDPKDILKGLECGADSFVVKPYQEDFLLSRIHYVLVNRELRHAGQNEIYFAGEKYRLTPGRTHSIDLLLSTYETAVQKNMELTLAKEKMEHQAGELRDKNAQMEADLDMARELQTAFLPQHYPVCPPGCGEGESALSFCHRYSATTELGGDFFDIMRVSDTEAGIFICDVMGHGVRAALVTAIIRGLVEELAPCLDRPAHFLSEMNQSLCHILKQTVTPLFASAFYAVVNIETGEIRHSNAGHPLPFVLDRSQGTIDRILPAGGKPGPALGVFPNSQYSCDSRQLAAGNFLILYTDGLYEVEGPDGEMFTQDQLAATLGEVSALHPCQLLDALMERILAWSAEGKFEDDVCMLGAELRRCGVS